MRKIVCFIMALTMMALATPVANASDPAVDAVQKRYAAIKTMRAEFTQKLIHKESGNTEERKGVLYFAKPLKVLWETQSPIPEILLVTPEAIWNAFPDEDMAYKYPPELSDDSGGIVRVVTGQSALNKDFTIDNEGVENGLTRLTLFPNKPTQSLTEAELMVDAKTGLIKSVKILDFYYNQNIITFTSQATDVAIPDATFTFTPAKNMKVEDRTKSEAANNPLLQ